MKLYEIAEQYRADVAKLQDLDLPPEAVLDTIESMQGELHDKLRAVIAVSMEYDAEEAALRGHAQRMLELAEAKGRRAESLRMYAQITIMNTGINTPINCGEFEAKLQANPLSCEITNVALLPPHLKSAEIKATIQGDGEALEKLVQGLSESCSGASITVARTVKADKRGALDALKGIEKANEVKPKGEPRDRLPGAVLNPRSYRLVVR
jgi:hypothetical protein